MKINKSDLRKHILSIGEQAILRSQGTFNKGVLNGQGIQYYQNGLKIWGEFEAGKPKGNCLVEIFDQRADFLAEIFDTGKGSGNKQLEKGDLEIFGEEESLEWEGSGQQGNGLLLLVTFAEKGSLLIF